MRDEQFFDWGNRVDAKPGQRNRQANDGPAETNRGKYESQARGRRESDQNLLSSLRSNPRNQQKAGSERAQDGSESVGAVHAGDDSASILSLNSCGSECQWETRTPGDRSGQQDQCGLG